MFANAVDKIDLIFLNTQEHFTVFFILNLQFRFSEAQFNYRIYGFENHFEQTFKYR